VEKGTKKLIALVKEIKRLLEETFSTSPQPINLGFGSRRPENRNSHPVPTVD
jgi:hypothetical protein